MSVESILFYIYGMQFTQQNKIYNDQVLYKYVCTWGEDKNSEIKTSTTIKNMF